jgi:hypothetical protein
MTTEKSEPHSAQTMKGSCTIDGNIARCSSVVIKAMIVAT